MNFPLENVLTFSGENLLCMNLEHNHCLYTFALFKVRNLFLGCFLGGRGVCSCHFQKKFVVHTVHIFLLSVWMKNKC